MRHSQWECNDPEFIHHVLGQGEVLYLSLAADSFPYLVPVNFVFLDGALYFHSAPAGAKIDIIVRDGRAAFSVTADVRIAREKSTTYYTSVCGTGTARLVEATDEKRRALDAIADRYGAACPRPTPEAALRNVAIVRIDIAAMTGKRHLPKQ